MHNKSFLTYLSNSQSNCPAGAYGGDIFDWQFGKDYIPAWWTVTSPFRKVNGRSLDDTVVPVLSQSLKSIRMKEIRKQKREAPRNM